jgi:hypothetical protein
VATIPIIIVIIATTETGRQRAAADEKGALAALFLYPASVSPFDRKP